MDYIKVEGHSNLKRDPQTNAIINDNMKDYNEYKKRKQIKSKEINKIQNMEDDLDRIKDDINDIKSLLKELINESK